MTADTPQDIVTELIKLDHISLVEHQNWRTPYSDIYARAADEIERLRASSKQAGPGGWNTALEEAAKAVECICVQAMNEDFVRGAREFRKGAANVIRALKASPAAAQPEPTDYTAAKQRHEVRVKAEGFDQVLTGPVELMKPPEPKASSPPYSEVVSFLLGEGPLDGCWFGDRHSTLKGAFWWRRYLRASAPHSAPDVVEALFFVRKVHDTFKRDIEQGFVTKDKQFAVDLLGRALASAGTPGEKNEQ